ncbi:hypothetical protein CPB83DRAFT_201474 [Crepidotus variabilis]|uniref:Uncharacterized protein n=1 Tax=Crepidotus variabilis TaxID=179855 RepID=A0A9P6EI67_9AGAR|nr:hypothetical protein CPB83DRAFT_201474 [Crepidotus variabilis]
MPSLPQELFHPIIEHISACHDLDERTHTLASTALVSRHFRLLAHKHLFATISFEIKDQPQTIEKNVLHHLRNILRPGPHSAVGRLHSLRKLLENPNAELRSVASHIRTFKLSLSVTKWTAEDILNDHAFPIILNQLFKQGHGHCSLVISTELVDRPDVPNMRGIDWEDLKQETREAIVSTCRSPLVKHLHLGFLNNLPRDILQGSRIRHLALTEITIAEPISDKIDTIHSNLLLSSLKFDQSVPIRHLLQSNGESIWNQRTFDHLSALDVTIFSSAGVHMTESILGHATSLNTLTIRVEPLQAASFHPMELGHLSHLKHLRMEILSGPNDDAIVDAGNILAIEADAPSSLGQITLVVRLTETDNPIKRHSLSLLDQRLANQRYVGVETVAIRCRLQTPTTIDLNQWREEESRRLIESFPLLAKCATQGKKRVHLSLDTEGH